MAALQVLALAASLVTYISAYRPEDETSLIQVELKTATAKVVNGEYQAPLAKLPTAQSGRNPCEAVVPNIPQNGKQPVLDAVHRCGELEKLCPDLDVIKANVDYPMTNKGEHTIVNGRPYIVQWDMFYDESGNHVEEDTVLRWFRRVSRIGGRWESQTLNSVSTTTVNVEEAIVSFHSYLTQSGARRKIA
jgi:hypothetical protein